MCGDSLAGPGVEPVWVDRTTGCSAVFLWLSAMALREAVSRLFLVRGKTWSFFLSPAVMHSAQGNEVCWLFDKESNSWALRSQSWEEQV
jgi:hypothetical protein